MGRTAVSVEGSSGLDGTREWASSLLLALLREDEEGARRAIERNRRTAASWMPFMDLADGRGVGPYVASLWRGRSLAAELPVEVHSWMEKRRRRSLYDNLLLVASARPLLARLQQRGIVPIVLKGCALMGRVYPDPGFRPMTDIDLLVPRGSAEEALRIASDEGMRPDGSAQKAARRRGLERNGASPLALDIHWDLSQKHRFQADVDGLWRRSIEFEFEGLRARRLAPVDEFTYLSLHYAAHYFGLTLKWLIDLREILRRETPEPTEVAERAREWGGRAGVHFALRYLRRVYPALGAAEALDRAVRRPLRDQLMRPFLSEDPFLLVKERTRGPARLAMGLLLVDRPSDMMRLGWVTLVAGGDDD